MAKHIHIEGTVRQRARVDDHLARLRHGARADGQRTEAARVRDGGGHARRGDTGHRRLDDGQLQAEAVEEGLERAHDVSFTKLRILCNIRI
ncbi:hypothetical protein D3C81_1819160 [compost metagenome]